MERAPGARHGDLPAVPVGLDEVAVPPSGLRHDPLDLLERDRVPRAQDVLGTAADHLGVRVAVQRLRGPVPERDPPLHVSGEDRGGRELQQRRLLIEPAGAVVLRGDVANRHQIARQPAGLVAPAQPVELDVDDPPVLGEVLGRLAPAAGRVEAGSPAADLVGRGRAQQHRVAPEHVRAAVAVHLGGRPGEVGDRPVAAGVDDHLHERAGDDLQQLSRACRRRPVGPAVGPRVRVAMCHLLVPHGATRPVRQGPAY